LEKSLETFFLPLKGCNTDSGRF